jgi:hypothetical protein
VSPAPDDLPVSVRLGTGAELRSVMCGHGEFVEHAVQMQVSPSKLTNPLNNRSAKARVCTRCRFVPWLFGREHHLELPEP